VYPISRLKLVNELKLIKENELKEGDNVKHVNGGGGL
jgi:hypothetical protein